MPYTHNEDMQIVQYIVKHKCEFKVTGTLVWRQMELENVR
jgi:hypothetical protein